MGDGRRWTKEQLRLRLQCEQRHNRRLVKELGVAWELVAKLQKKLDAKAAGGAT
jgi:hypothetical protein